MTTTYTYRELQAELKMFRDQMGYELEVKLNASAVELAMEHDRITDLIEESDMYDEIDEEIDEEIETHETLELVEKIDYKGTEIRIYHHDKGYIFEVEERKEIYQSSRSTRDEVLTDAKYYADKYIICDGSYDIICDDVDEFYAEFVVNADGEHVHPKGLNYIEWIEAKNMSNSTEFQSVLWSERINEMNYTYTPITKMDDISYRNQMIRIDATRNKKFEMMRRIAKRLS